jgi:hypothetical protein
VHEARWRDFSVRPDFGPLLASGFGSDPRYRLYLGYDGVCSRFPSVPGCGGSSRSERRTGSRFPLRRLRLSGSGASGSAHLIYRWCDGPREKTRPSKWASIRFFMFSDRAKDYPVQDILSCVLIFFHAPRGAHGTGYYQPSFMKY